MFLSWLFSQQCMHGHVRAQEKPPWLWNETNTVMWLVNEHSRHAGWALYMALVAGGERRGAVDDGDDCC